MDKVIGTIKITIDVLKTYIDCLKNVWTGKSVFWNIQSTFFHSDSEDANGVLLIENARNKYIKESSKVLKKIEKELNNK